MKQAIKKVLKSSTIGRALYSYIQNIYRHFSLPRARRRLHKYGYEVLKKVDEVAISCNVPYFASYGTLLGFIRDGGFIPHDADIDFGILPDSISPVELLDSFLNKGSGFKFIRALEFRHRITEITLSCHKIILDFFFYERDNDRMFVTSFYWEPDREYPSENENSVRFIYQAPVTALKKIKVHGVDVSIPINSEELIASQYGQSWRTPDPNWKNESHPGIIVQSDYGYAVGIERVYQLGNQ